MIEADVNLVDVRLIFNVSKSRLFFLASYGSDASHFGGFVRLEFLLIGFKQAPDLFTTLQVKHEDVLTFTARDEYFSIWMKGDAVVVRVSEVKFTNRFAAVNTPKLPAAPPGLCEKVFFIGTENQIVELVYECKLLDRFVGECINQAERLFIFINQSERSACAERFVSLMFEVLCFPGFANLHATLNVPDDLFILTSRHKRFTVFARLKRFDGICMTRKREEKRFALRVPHAHYSVAAARKEHSSIGTERERLDDPGMAHQPLPSFARSGIEDLHSISPVSWKSCDEATIAIEDTIVNLPELSFPSSRADGVEIF